MSHSVHPYAHRLGLIRDWRSRWFAVRPRYQALLRADILLREHLEKRLRGQLVGSVDLERGRNSLRVVVRTARPGLIIGRSGEGAQKLKNDIISFLTRLKSEVPRDFKLDIEEVRQPESHAAIAGALIAEGLEKRMQFRRVMKQIMEKILANKHVKGARIDLSGRLGGGDIARSESLKKGRLPLQTLRADIDFAREKAYLSYGVIGIKVWIYKGEIFSTESGSALS